MIIIIVMAIDMDNSNIVILMMLAVTRSSLEGYNVGEMGYNMVLLDTRYQVLLVDGTMNVEMVQFQSYQTW